MPPGKLSFEVDTCAINMQYMASGEGRGVGWGRGGGRGSGGCKSRASPNLKGRGTGPGRQSGRRVALGGAQGARIMMPPPVPAQMERAMIEVMDQSTCEPGI
jgi:hypothetical protein